MRFVNCNGPHIENFFINRGTDGRKGTLYVAAGLFLARCLRFRVHNVEVTGNGVFRPALHLQTASAGVVEQVA